MILTNDEKFKEWFARRSPPIKTHDVNSEPMSDDKLRSLNEDELLQWLDNCHKPTVTVVDMNSVTLSDDELKKLIDAPQTVIFFSPKFDPRLAATNLIDHDNVIVCNYKFAILCNLRYLLERK